MSISHMSLSVPTPSPLLYSEKPITGGTIPARSLFLTTNFSNRSLTRHGSIPFKTTTIRMGGGPRTYPGGVSKWQWKRMQNSKAKQLLKARLARERQIYEMRKRAELKAAVSELERPWEKVENPPNLFSVSADEQLKVLADRFQKPGGLDLWSERDGPEIFRTDNGLHSARFFPKGVVHSIKPYGKIANSSLECQELDSLSVKEDVPVPVSENAGKMSVHRKGGYKNSRIGNSRSDVGGNHSTFRQKRLEGVAREDNNGSVSGKIRTRGSRGTYRSNSEGVNFGEDRFNNRNSGRNGRQGGIDGEIRRSNSFDELERMNSEMFDMSLQDDCGYGFEDEMESP